MMHLAVRKLLFALSVALVVGGGLAGCARPLVVGGGAAQVDAALLADHAVMPDGYRLPLSVWRAAGDCQGTIIALHGLNDYRTAFSGTAKYFNRHGFTLLAYDQRGFGASQGAGLWHGSERLADDLRQMVELVRRRWPNCPVYVLGESMGGAVALTAAQRGGLPVDGLILVAPAVWSRERMPLYQRGALALAAHTVPGKKLTGEGLDLLPSDNIEMLRALGRDPLVIKATRVDVLYGVTNLMDRAAQTDAAVLGRTLIVYGAHDDIIPAQPLCGFMEDLGDNSGGQRTALMYPHGYHMLTRDLQADAVHADMVAWMQGRLASQPVAGRDLQQWCTTRSTAVASLRAEAPGRSSPPAPE